MLGKKWENPNVHLSRSEIYNHWEQLIKDLKDSGTGDLSLEPKVFRSHKPEGWLRRENKYEAILRDMASTKVTEQLPFRSGRHRGAWRQKGDKKFYKLLRKQAKTQQRYSMKPKRVKAPKPEQPLNRRDVQWQNPY